jgi:PAS domain S-box-containing protein
MQSNLSQLQSRQIAVIARLTPHGLAGHILNTSVAAIAVAGSVPLVQLIIWCTYSYSIALIILFRHLKGRVKGQGRSPRNFDRAVKKVTLYAVLLAVSWSSLIILRLGAMAPEEEIVLVALVVGMSASGTILLSAVPPAAFSYMSAILIPSALKCFFLFDQKSYVLLGVLAVSYWAFLAALIGKITRETGERMSADIALLESEARYRALYEDNPSMYFTVDSAGTVLSVNRFGAQQLGWTTAELLGQSVLRVIHEDDRATAKRLLALCAQDPGTVAKQEIRKVRRDGSILWVREVVRAVSNTEGQTVVLTVCEEITERRQAEIALQESQARLQEALTAGQVIAFAWDAQAGLSKRSENSAQILGFESDHGAKGNRFLARVHPDDRARFCAHVYGVRPESPSYSARFRFIRPDSREVWLEEVAKAEFDAAGRILRIKGLTRDITERKRTEEKLQESERSLRELFAALPAAIYTTDAAGRITYCNQGAVDLWGLKPKLARDRWCDLARFYRADGTSLALDECPTDIALKQGRVVLSREMILERHDGTRIPIISYPTPLRDRRGAIVGVVNMTVDISERKKAEHALAERNVQLALAGKAALVGSYAYDTKTELMQVSAGYAAIHGFPEGTTEIARSECVAGLHPEDARRLEMLRNQASRERRSELNAEYRIVRSNGEIRWIETRGFMSYSSDGRPQRVIGVSIDVTERKLAEEQQRVLVAELDHRVKNMLATVSVVATRTQDASASVADFVAAFEGRIKAMAIAHELLSVRRWQGLPLAELVRRELAPYATSKNTEIDGPEVILRAEAGQAMAVGLHELVTNAAKYGALSTDDGRVSIRWYCRLNGGAHVGLAFEWQEIGGPSVATPSNQGYGTSVIREIIPYELGGTAELTFAPEGVRCRLEIPVDSLSDGTWPDRFIGSGPALPFQA